MKVGRFYLTNYLTNYFIPLIFSLSCMKIHISDVISVGKIHFLVTDRPVARNDFGELGDPKMVDLFDRKIHFFESHPLKSPTKPHLWPILWLKVILLADLGWCIAHLGYGQSGMVTEILRFSGNWKWVFPVNQVSHKYFHGPSFWTAHHIC